MSDTIPIDAYVMIIGAMKCGTSSLFHYLQGHPQICASRTKEPEYFSENQGHGDSVKDYADLFSFDTSKHKCTLEASTGYTKYPLEPNVARNIYNYGIKPKFIYIIRNPFERIESHYNFMQKDNNWSLKIDSEHLINTNNYYLQLEQYRRYFPLKNIQILDFDDLKYRPDELLKQVYSFLDLADDYFPASYGVKNMTPNVSKLEKRMDSEKIAPILRKIPKPVKKYGKIILRKSLPSAKRVLSSSEKDFVYNELKDSMAELSNVYGFDAGKWGFDS